MVREEQSYYSNLRHVTLGDAWECGKPALAIWAFISAVALAVGYLGSVTAPVAIDLGVPAGAMWFMAACLFLWFLRGEEIGFTLPSVSAGQWLLWCLVGGGALLLFGALPPWATVLAACAFIVGCGVVHVLVVAGRATRQSRSMTGAEMSA